MICWCLTETSIITSMKYISLNLHLCYQDIFHLCCESLKCNPKYQIHLHMKERYIHSLTYIRVPLHKPHETQLLHMFWIWLTTHQTSPTRLLPYGGCWLPYTVSLQMHWTCKFMHITHVCKACMDGGFVPLFQLITFPVVLMRGYLSFCSADNTIFMHLESFFTCDLWKSIQKVRFV